MNNKSKGLTILIGAIVFCAAGGIAWVTIKNLVIAFANGLSGGLGNMLVDWAASPFLAILAFCIAGGLVVLTIKNLIVALANGIKAAAKPLNDSVSSVNGNEYSNNRS